MIQDLIEFWREYFDDAYDPENINRIILTQTKHFLIENKNIKQFVIPISGGLDSAICTALLSQIDFPISNIWIPINNSETHYIYAKQISDLYNTEFFDVNLFDENIKFINDINNVFKHNNKIALGNIKARLRMIIAYHFAQLNHGIVVSTDNLSEYLMGFWTLHGDVGDFSPIQFLSKGFVLPNYAKYLNIPEKIINQPPSDGLGVTDEDTDAAQLGALYEEVDAIVLTYLFFKDELSKYLLSAPNLKCIYKNDFDWFIRKNEYAQNIIDRYERTRYKRNGIVSIKF